MLGNFVNTEIKIIRNKKLGFTLVEVLLTLTVIGVIAALTIPNLVFSVQKHEYATRLEKFFSTMNNGFKMIMAKKGCSDIPCTGIMNSSRNTTAINVENAGVFNIIKRCNQNESGCHDQQVYNLSGGTAWALGTYPSNYYSLLVTSDGMVWGFYDQSTDCSFNVGSGGMSNSCTQRGFVDVNGEKLPNKFGRDVFRFYILSDGRVVPTGMDNDTFYNIWSASSSAYSCNSNHSGETCAARIALDGWEMNY